MAGQLAIFANGGGLLEGHAWIAFQSDTTGETHSYGTWGNNPTGEGNGLFMDIERNNGMTSADASRSIHINDQQEAALKGLIADYADRGQDGWKLLAPCSAFAQDAWEAGAGEYLNANTKVLVNNPETLRKSIVAANGGEASITIQSPDKQSSATTSSGSASAGSGKSANSSIQPIFYPE